MTSDPSRVMRVQVKPPVWWSALGGPNAVSVWSWFVTTGVALFVALAYEVPTFDYRMWQRLGLVLTTQITLIPVFVVGHKVLARMPRSVPLVGLVIFVDIGVLRGVSITALAPYVEPLARPGLGFQVLVGVTYALLSLPFIAIVVDALRRHRLLQARVLNAQDEWERALRATEDEFNAEYSIYRQRVENEVSSRVIGLTDDLASAARTAATSGAMTAAEELRRLSAEVVRPLSHELILDAAPARVAPINFAPPPPLLGLRDVLKEASRTPTAGNWVVCAAMVLLSAVGLAPLTTPTFIAVNIAWDVVIFGFVPVFVQRIGRRWWDDMPLRVAWLASAGLWAGLAILGVTGTAALGGIIAGTAVFYWSAGAFYILISVGTVIAWTAFRRLRALDDEYIALLGEQEEFAARVMARLDRNRRHLGLVLHGSVQSSLTHAARRLEQWADDMDSETLPGVVEEVRAALHAALVGMDLEPPVDVNLESVLSERTALWADSIECSLDVSDDIMDVGDPLLAEQIGDITGEAITNAVRHGRADTVAVTVYESDGALELMVSDNGLGPGDSLPTGGGIGHLMRSGYAWTLERQGDRTLLSVRIPMVRHGMGLGREREP